MLLLRLKDNMPRYYDGIYEMEELLKAEQIKFDELEANLGLIYTNQFIQTADEKTISDLEKLFYIIPDKLLEGLDFRRDRILNRFATNPPFTLYFLYQKLNTIVGKNRWTVEVDYDNYTLYISTAASDANFLGEIIATVNAIKPCHIVFVYKPVIEDKVSVTEQINQQRLQWNYQLGTTWLLGAKPFASFEDLGVVKLPELSSIQQPLLNDNAAFTASDVSYAKINNSITISTFSIKNNNQNTATISYSVTVDMFGANQPVIETVQLFNSSNSILTESKVYAPILLENVLLTHTIIFKEAGES